MNDTHPQERRGRIDWITVGCAVCIAMFVMPVVLASLDGDIKWILLPLGIALSIMLAVLVQRRQQWAIFALVVSSGINYKRGLWEPAFVTLHTGGALDQPVLFLADLPAALLLIAALLMLGTRTVRFPRPTLFDGLMVLFVAVSAASYVNVTRGHELFYLFEMVRMVKFAALYLALRVLFAEPANRKAVWIGCAVAGAIQAVTSLAEYYTGFHPPFISAWISEITYGTLTVPRVGGLVGYTNQLATYMIIPICLCLSGAITSESTRGKVWYSVAFAFCIVPVALSFRETAG